MAAITSSPTAATTATTTPTITTISAVATTVASQQQGMTAVQVIEKGTIAVRSNIAVPEPLANQLRVRVHAVGLNPVDNYLITGYVAEQSYPFVLGLDASGVVDKVGDDVTDFKVGDRVFYHGDYRVMGAFAQYACITAHTVSRLPSDVSFQVGAALPCAGLTAYLCLFRRLPVRSGDTILITSGAGGVGGFAVQLARHLGATVIATCSAANMTHVTELGAHHVIGYTDDVAQVVAKVLELTKGRGVMHVLDGVSGEYSADLYPCIAWGGHLAYISGQLPSLPPFYRSLTIHQIALGSAHVYGTIDAQRDLATMGNALVALVQKGIINPRLVQSAATYIAPSASPTSSSTTAAAAAVASSTAAAVKGLHGIYTALDMLAAKHVIGKLVVTVE